MLTMFLQKARHFDQRWEERLKCPAPSTETVLRILDESVRIQKFNVLYTVKGKRVKVLGLYWNAKRRLFFKIDELTRKVVTVVPGNLAQMVEETADGE